MLTARAKPHSPNLRSHRTLVVLRQFLALWLLVALGAGAGVSRAAPDTAAGQQDEGITLTARAGFDGYYKDTRWVPMRVLVANDGPDFTGTLRVTVPRSSSQVNIVRQVELPTQSRREIFLYIPTESFVSSLRVTLNDSKVRATANARVVQAGANDLIYGVLAGSPSSFNMLSSVDPVNGTAFVAQLELGDLPPIGFAWQSLDVLVISDVDTGALSAEQRAAMAGWVAAGGRLIVTGGPGWQKTAAGLAELLPLLPTGTRTLPDLASLATYALAAAPEGSAVAATGDLKPDAAVLHSGGALPLIAARRSGFGQVIYLAVDPAFDPLKNWAGLEGLFRNLLSGVADRPNWSNGVRNWYSAQQAANALPGLDFPSSFQICGFLGIYLIVVGPLNYLFLKRIKRRELAWLTIPAIVLVFSGGAYLTGYQLRGAKPILHRLSMVQVWPDAEYARVDGLVGLFSPRRTNYDLGFAEGFLVRPLPTDSYGSPPSYTVQQADRTQIDDVRMEIGSVEPFLVNGLVAAPQFAADLVLEVGRNSVNLRGTLTNRSNLTLTGPVVLAPGGAVHLNNLAPGASATVNMPLLDARASPASVNSVLPAVPAQSAGSPQPYYPPSTYDSTIDDICNCPNSYNDREQFRRYQLLSAIIESYSGSVRGSGVYLVGWTEQAPFESEVIGESFNTIDTTIYFVSLRPALSVSEGEFVIPPALMTWLALNPGQSVSATPYDMYAYQGTEYILRFRPAQLVPYKGVTGLTMHLDSYGIVGPFPAQLELWDFTEGVWVAQTNLSWGDTEVAHPARFVGPAGEIQVRVANGNQPQLSIERLDFTLHVQQ